MELVDAKKAQKTMVQALQRVMPFIEKKLGPACIDMSMGPQRPDLCFISWKTHPSLKAADSVLRIRRYDALGDCILYIEYMHKNSKWDQESMQRIYEDSDMGRDVMGILREVQKFTFVNKPYDASMQMHYSKIKNAALVKELRILEATWKDLGVNPYRQLSASRRILKSALVDDLDGVLKITPAMSIQKVMAEMRPAVGWHFRKAVFAQLAKEIKRDKRAKLVMLEGGSLLYKSLDKSSIKVGFGTDSVGGLDFVVRYYDETVAGTDRREDFLASDTDSLKSIVAKLLSIYTKLTQENRF